MLLVQKWQFFQLFVLGNKSQDNVFYNILGQKNGFLGYKNKKLKKSGNWHFSKGVNLCFWSSLRSMAVLSSRAQERRSHEKFPREARENERRSREKNKNRLPGFVAFSTAAPFNSFWHPVDNLFGFSFPSQSEIKCWQPKHDTKARDIV